MPYGYLQTGNNVAKQLKELNRDYEGRKIWSKMYSNIDSASKSSINAIERDYASDITKAYESAYKNKMLLQSSNLGEGFKSEGIADLALSEAYESYRQNYLDKVSTVNQNADQARAKIDEVLLSESRN